MIVVNDTGDSLVNYDSAFAIGMNHDPNSPGITLVIAFGPGVTTVLTAGSEQRARECLEAIRKGIKQNWKILDLRDELGQRPNLDIPAPKIVVPGNGQTP
jgi:hypothetical protein